MVPSISSRVWEKVSSRRIGAVHDRGDAACVIHQDRRHVHSADRGVDAGVAGGQALDLSEQRAGDIEDVDSQVLDDEARIGRQVGLRREHVMARTKANPPEERPPHRAVAQRGQHCADRGLPAEILVPIRVRPAASIAATMARASSSVSAKGFWQMTCRPARAAASTKG